MPDSYGCSNNRVVSGSNLPDAGELATVPVPPDCDALLVIVFATGVGAEPVALTVPDAAVGVAPDDVLPMVVGDRLMVPTTDAATFALVDAPWEAPGEVVAALDEPHPVAAAPSAAMKITRRHVT